MCKPSEKYKNCRRGSVLVLVLIVLSAMTIVAFGLAYQTRIEIRLSNSSSQQAVVRNLALAGLEAATAILSERDLTVPQTAKVCRFYPAEHTRQFFEQLSVSLDEDTQVVFWIKDESSFLDLNRSDSAVWENLSAVGRDKRACVLDWLDSDSDTNPGGAETDYYERLETPYICKNAAFVCLRELLLVRNIIHDDYLKRIATETVAHPEDLEGLFGDEAAPLLSLVDTFTTFGREQVNVNTVSGAILAILPGLDRQTADLVLTYRYGPDGVANTDDDRFLETVEDIRQIEGLTELQKELLGQYCCFNSDAFRVISLARKNQQLCLLMATVRTTENPPQVICVERLL